MPDSLLGRCLKMDLSRSAAFSTVEPSPARARDSWATLAAESLFTRPGPQARIVIKKRRELTVATEAPAPGGPPAPTGPVAATAVATPGRAPRVFVARRADEHASERPEISADPERHESPRTGPAESQSAAPLRRRRKPAAHSPGPVLRIVVRPDATAAAPQAPGGVAHAAAASADTAGSSSGRFELHLPEPGLHKALITALAAVGTLLDEAAAAGRWRF